MTTFIIEGNKSLNNIDFAPENELLEVLQNVRTILSTVKFSVPLDRDFGIDASLLDKSILEAKAKISSEIILAIKKYEPRVKVEEITFSGDIDGKLQPKVQVSIIETQ
ncbi:GPW/gp25 family protein [Megamonas hypermegale]|uniref:GPW/gp25 family protein n=1 Tax=Megamonas hypermegale TaxID=158847 RepID=UPI0026F04582|nr:GPW/gp25 family protein [Megamonas hypermegale]